nr:replication factor C [Tanacetum cinerariifolium]
MDALSQIIKNEGAESLFKGVGANILRAIVDKLQSIIFGNKYGSLKVIGPDCMKHKPAYVQKTLLLRLFNWMGRAYSRGLQKHSLSVMKQGRSGYEPSDTETELQEANWIEFNKRITEAGVDEVRSVNAPRLTRRHSSKFDPEGLPPPRRHSKSPYKTRRDDGNPKSPTQGPLPLPPGRNISPFSKSERRRHVSPFKARDSNNESYRETKKPDYNRTLSAPRLRPRDKDQHMKLDQRVKRREERSRTPPSRRSNHRNVPSVGEINEMVANAKLAKSPVRQGPVFDSSGSLPGGDIFFSKDYAALSAQKIKTPAPVQRYKSIHVPNYNTTNGIGISSSSMLTPATNISSSVVSRQSSNISDVSAKSTGSSWKFAANRRKSQTDAWFSCIGKGSCRSSKKSPERARAFDEASFIEKAFVNESIRQFWADKHQPSSLNGFTCHKQEALQLQQLASQDIFPHILLKGPQGSGRKALTMALLREIYGDAARNITHELRYFQIQEARLTQVAVPITSSCHHVELNVHLEANARYALMASVKQISSDHSVAPEISTVNLKPDYTVMVLYDVDKADESIQHLIKWIIDCYSDVCKLVLCCEDDVDILEPVKSRCHIIKLDAPVTHEIMEILIQIARKENFDLSMKFASKIATKSKQNLRKAIMALEACKSHNYPFVEDQPIAIGWEDVLIDLAAEVLADPSHKRQAVSHTRKASETSGGICSSKTNSFGKGTTFHIMNHFKIPHNSEFYVTMFPLRRNSLNSSLRVLKLISKGNYIIGMVIMTRDYRSEPVPY